MPSWRKPPRCPLLLLLLPFAMPVSANDDIRARIADAGTADDYDADAVVVVDWEDVMVRPNGIGTARHQRVVKILREAAIRDQAVQVFPFDPHTNRLELIAVRVYREDGTVDEVDLDHVAKQPQTAYGIFWPTDQFLVSIPRLAVGDAIETITEMTGFNVAYLGRGMGVGGVSAELNAYGQPLEPPVLGHWHDEVHFWSSIPVIEQRYSVRLPKEMPLQYEMYNGTIRPAVTFDETHMTYSFEMTDIEPYATEPRMEPKPNVLPKLLLATLPTWEDKARWLYEVSEPQFEADEAIREKVAEIIADCETDEEKYWALNKWVAENIRYAGTSRGMAEGYTVHRSIETFHDKCGVCKDKAGILVTMLRVAGFDSFLVMTMARQRVDPIPADQFNHAVTCIRWDDGSLTLLDPTWMPDSRDNWSTLEPLQHVVYGLPEGGGLAQSPYFSPEECQGTWQATSRIAPNNTLHGSLSFKAVGTPEGRIRRTFNSLHPSNRADYFDRTFQRLAPNARAVDVRMLPSDDYSGPLKIACDFMADDFVLGSGARRYLALPMLQTVFGDRALYDLFGYTDAEEREYGMNLLATRRALIKETVTLPPGWEAVELPQAVSIDGPSAAIEFEIEVDGNEIRYTCDLRVKRWQIPPDEYANFKEVVEAFENLTGRVVVCDTEGASND